MTGAVNAGGTWTNVTPATVLAGMLDVLSGEEKWCQKEGARNVFGDPTSPMSGDAVQFCMMGALGRTMDQTDFGWVHTVTGWDLHKQVSDLIIDQLPNVRDRFLGPIPNFNDDPSTTFEDVRLVLKRALGEAQ